MEFIYIFLSEFAGGNFLPDLLFGDSEEYARIKNHLWRFSNAVITAKSPLFLQSSKKTRKKFRRMIQIRNLPPETTMKSKKRKNYFFR